MDVKIWVYKIFLNYYGGVVILVGLGNSEFIFVQNDLRVF